MARILSLALFVLSSFVSAQFITPPSDLQNATGNLGIPVRYKQVPNGICETDPHIKSYSGYVDVSENEHIFWWFFETRNGDPTHAPLTVWINGGPGSSSMIGLFQELGPCSIDENLNVVNNPYSWSNVSNMLFIDQPTTTGFSYSVPVPGYQDPSTGDIIALPNNTCPSYPGGSTCGTYSAQNLTLTANTTANAASNMWLTLQGFMGAFPQYASSGFHFTTESYGGHYGPVFNEYFTQQNAMNIAGAQQISLRSVHIGNGWFNPLVQYGSYYNMTVYPGNTYDFSPFTTTIEEKMYNAMYGPGNCHDQIKFCHQNQRDDVCSAADNFCASEVEEILDKYGKRDEYDIREMLPDPFPPSWYTYYLNQPKVLKAIGAFQNFSSFSNTVGLAFAATGDDGRQSMTVNDIRRLIAQDITVYIYAGDADYICNWIGNEVIAHRSRAPGFDSAGYADIKTSDGVTHGQVKQAGKFAFARIYESGHEVPFYQPLAALEIFTRVINGIDIQTGTQLVSAGYVTKGTKKSTYHEGSGTVQHKTIPSNWFYNTTSNKPEPPSGGGVQKRAVQRTPSINEKMARNPRWAYRQMLKRHIASKK